MGEVTGYDLLRNAGAWFPGGCMVAGLFIQKCK